LEARREATITLADFEQTEEIEDLGCGPDGYDTALFANGNCRYPEWNEPVLAAWQSELGMTEDLKEKPSVSS
jgi:hypothetical protein